MSRSGTAGRILTLTGPTCKIWEMDARITDEELELLAWLHENVKGFNQPFALLSESVCNSLQIDRSELARRVSFLQGFGLVGAMFHDTTHLGSTEPETMLRTLWLTSLGENYMRVLENDRQIGRRITVESLKQIGAVAHDVASRVLAEFLAAMMRGSQGTP